MRTFVKHVCNAMSFIAGIILIVMMVLTFADILLRYFGHPILGAYEVVSFLGVAVTSFALPRASLLKTHVYVDLLIDGLPPKPQRILRVITRLLVFLLFLIAAWYFIVMGKNYIQTKTVTMSLKVPFFPVVFGLAASCLAQCLVSLYEIFGERRVSNE
jgi:TRAP-type C4-dicarboxylate transport system permease small subunit